MKRSSVFPYPDFSAYLKDTQLGEKVTNQTAHASDYKYHQSTKPQFRLHPEASRKFEQQVKII